MFSSPDSAASGSTSLIGNSLLDVQIVGSSSDPSAHCSTPSHRSLTWMQSRLNDIREDGKSFFIYILLNKEKIIHAREAFLFSVIPIAVPFVFFVTELRYFSALQSCFFIATALIMGVCIQGCSKCACRVRDLPQEFKKDFDYFC